MRETTQSATALSNARGGNLQNIKEESVKLINVVVFYFCFVLVLCGVFFCGSAYLKLCEKSGSEKQKYECTRFVSESFKMTCEGRGFENLLDWQKKCRALWNLEYIGWAFASDFMEVSEHETGLVYGKWNNEFCDGEIFYLMED